MRKLTFTRLFHGTWGLSPLLLLGCSQYSVTTFRESQTFCANDGPRDDGWEMKPCVSDSWRVDYLEMGGWMVRFGGMKMREILGNLRATKGMQTLRKLGQLKWSICPEIYQGRPVRFCQPFWMTEVWGGKPKNLMLRWDLKF